MTNQTQYLAIPPSGNGSGVLVLHAWWGMTDFIRQFCDRLAQEGFVALAPDMFAGKVAHTVAEAEQLLPQMQQESGIPDLLLAATDPLSQRAAPHTPLATIGFSFGGNWALWLAQQKPDLIRAVTLFYATDGGTGNYQQSKAAFLGHFAEADPYEPAAEIRALEQNLKSAARPVAFYTYPGTGHWFAETDRADAYNAQAAQLAWDRTIAFLRFGL